MIPGSTSAIVLEVTTPQDEVLLVQDAPGQFSPHPALSLLTQTTGRALSRLRISHGTSAPPLSDNQPEWQIHHSHLKQNYLPKQTGLTRSEVHSLEYTPPASAPRTVPDRNPLD